MSELGEAALPKCRSPLCFKVCVCAVLTALQGGLHALLSECAAMDGGGKVHVSRRLWQ